MAEQTNNTHTDAGKETLQDLTNRKQTRIYTPKWHWYTHRGWTNINKDAFAVKHARKKPKNGKSPGPVLNIELLKTGTMKLYQSLALCIHKMCI